MRAVIRFGTVIGVVAVVCAFSAAQHPGRNSFLVESARSTDQLISEVRSNSNIRDSYERHFRMTEDQLYTYLRTLHPVRLDHDDVFTVYSVPPGGELKAHTQRLKKGELVFADMNGKPILRARCGNPLVGTPPGVVPDAELAVSTPEMKDMPVPEAELVPNVPLAMAPAPPVIPEEVVFTPPATPVVTSSQGIPLLPLLALPVVGATGGGGHTPGTPTPEPATMAALAAGAGALMVKRRKKS
jgi:hypothetical protein